MRPLFVFLLVLSLSAAILADARKIVILQTTDIHSHLSNKNAEEASGWIRLASIIKKERAQGNTLLIDCGDTLQGALVGSVSKGQAAAEMLNLLKYDVWIPGNHDFDFGIKILEKRCSEIKADKLAANIKWENAKIKTLPWKIYHLNEMKIAVIGLGYPEMDNYYWQGGRHEFKVEDAEKTIDLLMPEVLASTPDMIILALHNGYQPVRKQKEPLISRIAKRHPEINLILGGHIHQEEPGRLIGHSVWYASAGYHAQKLLKAEAEIEKEKHKVISIKSILIPLTHSTPEDPEYAEKMSGWLKKTSEFARLPTGETLEKISPPGEGAFNSTMNELACRAMAKTANAEIAFSGAGAGTEFRNRIFEGNLFNAFPYEDTICTLELSQDELKSIIYEQLANRKQHFFQAPWGFHSEITEGKIGNICMADGKSWTDENKRIKTAFSSYALASAGGKFPILKKMALKQECLPYDTGILERNAVRNYIKSNSPLNIKEEKWLKDARRKPQHRKTSD